MWPRLFCQIYFLCSAEERLTAVSYCISAWLTKLAHFQIPHSDLHLYSWYTLNCLVLFWWFAFVASVQNWLCQCCRCYLAHVLLFLINRFVVPFNITRVKLFFFSFEFIACPEMHVISTFQFMNSWSEIDCFLYFGMLPVRTHSVNLGPYFIHSFGSLPLVFMTYD